MGFESLLFNLMFLSRQKIENWISAKNWLNSSMWLLFSCIVIFKNCCLEVLLFSNIVFFFKYCCLKVLLSAASIRYLSPCQQFCHFLFVFRKRLGIEDWR